MIQARWNRRVVWAGGIAWLAIVIPAMIFWVIAEVKDARSEVEEQDRFVAEQKAQRMMIDNQSSILSQQKEVIRTLELESKDIQGKIQGLSRSIEVLK